MTWGLTSFRSALCGTSPVATPSPPQNGSTSLRCEFGSPIRQELRELPALAARPLQRGLDRLRRLGRVNASELSHDTHGSSEYAAGRQGANRKADPMNSTRKGVRPSGQSCPLAPAHFRVWKTEGDAALAGLASGAIHAAVESGSGQVQVLELGHRCGHLAPIALIA